MLCSTPETRNSDATWVRISAFRSESVWLIDEVLNWSSAAVSMPAFVLTQ